MNHELFVNFEHQKRFMELRQQLNEKYMMDKQWISLVFLVSGNKELEQKILPYIHFLTGEFDFEGMLQKNDFTEELNVLAKLAVDFYTGNDSVFVNELVNLNRMNFDLALAVTRIRHKIGWFQTAYQSK